MAEKRKDKNGHILKTGENQRKNGTYDYRYTDSHGKVRCVYAKTLESLRRKEETIQRDMADGIDYAAGEITVSELVDRYMNLKRDLSENTRRAYSTVINRIKEAPFGQMKVRTVKLSDAKAFYISLHDNGNKRNTISIFHGVLRPSFEMAVDDDMIRKNPFKFQVSDILQNDAEKPYFITSPKTSSGVRTIPMSDTVYLALKRVVKNRQTGKAERIVDGYGGFLFLDKSGMPKVAMHLENYMRGIQKKVNRLYGASFPRVTPHVLRHTFCTNMQQAGIDVKSLQYLMGHSNVSVTLDVYTHTDFNAVQEAFTKAAASL